MKKVDIDFSNIKFEMASQETSVKYKKEMDKLLKYLGSPEALVSDESKIWDFLLSEQKVDSISKKLGFKINNNDFLIDITKKMKRKHST